MRSKQKPTMSPSASLLLSMFMNLVYTLPDLFLT